MAPRVLRGEALIGIVTGTCGFAVGRPPSELSSVVCVGFLPVKHLRMAGADFLGDGGGSLPMGSSRGDAGVVPREALTTGFAGRSRRN